MNMDRMYELAFKFRDTKLWNYVYEDELFAVKLSDGRFAFCSIMGNSGQHIMTYIDLHSCSGAWTPAI